MAERYGPKPMKQKDFKFQSELFDYPDIYILALLPFLSSIINSPVFRFNQPNCLCFIINLKLVLMEEIKEAVDPRKIKYKVETSIIFARSYYLKSF